MKRLMCAITAALSAFALFGTDLTWTGEAGDSLLTTAANWSPAQAPASGDKLIFTKSVTLEKETIDVGTSGLTFDTQGEYNSSKDIYSVIVTTKFTLTGSGSVTKEGCGELCVTHALADYWTHTGYTIINDGKIRILQGSGGGTVRNPIGGSEIKINRTETEYPVLHYRTGDIGFPTIRITGPYTANKPALKVNGSVTLACKIYSEEDDFFYSVDFGGQTFTGGIYAHGHKMYFGHYEFSPDTFATFDCTVDCSIDLADARGNYYFNSVDFKNNFRLLDPNSTITIRKIGQQYRTINGVVTGPHGTGYAHFWPRALFNGKLITTSTCPQVVIDGDLFRGIGAMELATETTLTLADGVKLTTGGLKQGDTTLAAGKYAKQEDGSWAEDENGPLVVKASRQPFVRYIGSASTRETHDWLDATCWEDGRVPTADAYVLIDRSAAFTYENTDGSPKEFDLSGGGITLDIQAAVATCVKFTGTGTITKEGTGTLYVRNGQSEPASITDGGVNGSKAQSFRDQSTYTGGTYLRNGKINIQCGQKDSSTAPNFGLGTGPIYIVRQSSISPELRFRFGYYSGLGKIYIQGPMVDNSASLCWNQNGTINDIEAEDDFIFAVTSGGPIYFNGTISAHGHNMIMSMQEYHSSRATFNSMVDASIVLGRDSDGHTLHTATFGSNFILTDPESSIMATLVATNVFNAGATVCGSYIHNAANKKSTQELLFNGTGTYIKSLTLADANLVTATDAAVKVGALTVGETTYGKGTQTIGGGTFTIDPDFSMVVWTGATDSNWNNPENWNCGRVPAGGDWVRFSKYIGEMVSTTTDGTETAVPIDITDDITIEVVGSGTIVDCFVQFIGSGSLTKEGAGRLSFGRQDSEADSEPVAKMLPTTLFPTYTGHTIINNGTLYVYVKLTAFRFTLPYVEINRATGRYPMLYHRSGRAEYKEIHVTGAHVKNQRDIQINSEGGIFGPIYSPDGDLEIENKWSQPTLNAIHAAGHTIYVHGWDNLGVKAKFDGAVEGDLVIGNAGEKFGQVRFGSGFSTTGSISVLQATEVLFDSTIKLSGGLSIANGTMLNIPSGNRIRATTMSVDGTTLEDAKYTKDSTAAERAFITSDGTLVVGAFPGTMMFLQ